MTGFAHTFEQIDRGVVAHLTGDLDLAAAPELADAIRTAREMSEGDIVLDMSGVTFLDSSGLRAIVAAHHDAADDSRIVIRRPSDAVTRVLEITGLQSGLHIET
jgi:anti-sigma B factor antagonist